VRRGLNHLGAQRTHAESKALKATAGFFGHGLNWGRRGLRNVKRALASDELVRLRGRGSPCRVNPGRGSGVK